MQNDDLDVQVYLLTHAQLDTACISLEVLKHKTKEDRVLQTVQKLTLQ